jgi:transposase-like protein
MPRRSPFSEEAARAAIAAATCWAEALRILGYVPRGHNHRTLQRWAREWAISTDHFDANAARGVANHGRRRPLEEILVENSRYSRDQLKRRLFEAGLKPRGCEMCGQGETWRGQRMSLVLDHVNGDSSDNRLENLRIVCPNCAATLDTHCGRKLPRERICPGCGEPFTPRHIRHRYCSQRCWGTVSSERKTGVPQPDRRKVTRPSHEQLLADLEAMSWLAVGRKYGVSDNAVRKWVRTYEAPERGSGTVPQAEERAQTVSRSPRSDQEVDAPAE